MTYWEVVAQCPAHESAHLRASRSSCIIGNCLVRIEDGRVSLVSNIKADDRFDAEQTAMAVFDEITTALVLSERRPWRFKMHVPIEIQSSQADESLLVEAVKDKICSLSGTEQVSPSFDSSMMQKLVHVVDSTQVDGWLRAIRGANPRTRRLIQYFRRGVALGETLPEEAFMCFAKVIEAFLEEYRTKFEGQRAVRNTEAFKNELYPVVVKHFPEASEKERSQILSRIQSLRFYTNRELIEYVCRESGYFENVLKSREANLRDLVEMAYAYLSPEERAQQFHEIFDKHVIYVKTQTPRLWDVRPKAAHFTDGSDIVHTFIRDCGLLARYLITKELETQGSKLA